MKEIWKPIPGYFGYEASSLGRIRSVDRKIWVDRVSSRGYWLKCTGRMLAICNGPCGYYIASISIGNKQTTGRVGRLVCLAFHGLCPENMECCHGRKGQKVDTPYNVYWGTKSENELDKVRDGTSNCKSILRSDGKIFASMLEAAQSVNGTRSHLSRAVNGKLDGNKAYGFAWKEA